MPPPPTQDAPRKQPVPITRRTWTQPQWEGEMSEAVRRWMGPLDRQNIPTLVGHSQSTWARHQKGKLTSTKHPLQWRKGRSWCAPPEYNGPPGWSLGPRLIQQRWMRLLWLEKAHKAQQSIDIPQVPHPLVEEAKLTCKTTCFVTLIGSQRRDWSAEVIPKLQRWTWTMIRNRVETSCLLYCGILSRHYFFQRRQSRFPSLDGMSAVCQNHPILITDTGYGYCEFLVGETDYTITIQVYNIS